jgi:hypothetical protein
MVEIGLTTESRGKWRSHFVPALGVSLLVPRSWQVEPTDGGLRCHRGRAVHGVDPVLTVEAGPLPDSLAAADAIDARARALGAALPAFEAVAACELWIDDRAAWWLDHRHDAADGTRMRARVCEVQAGEAEVLRLSCACADAAWASQDPWFEVVIRSVRFIPRP